MAIAAQMTLSPLAQKLKDVLCEDHELPGALFLGTLWFSSRTWTIILVVHLSARNCQHSDSPTFFPKFLFNDGSKLLLSN